MAEQFRYYDTGKRKSAIARVWLTAGEGKISVNRRAFEDYFPLETHKTVIESPLKLTNTLGQYDAYITVRGGGVSGAGECDSPRHCQKPAAFGRDISTGSEAGGFSETGFTNQGTQEIRTEESAQAFSILQTLRERMGYASAVMRPRRWPVLDRA